MALATQLDIDELAREKVDEIEQLLNSSEEHKVDVINTWFSLLKQIITAADLHRTNDNSHSNRLETKLESDESIYADYADDNEQFNAIDLTEQFASNSVKWTIRVKAFKIVHRLVQILGNSNRSVSSKLTLIKHLSDLVRLSFVAATSPYDDLKIQGFEMFKSLINRFALVEEREFPGSSILEQYRTQFLSALKPAFNLDAPPYITAIASQVCSLWICKGLERDSFGLRRAYQLMACTIEKLENQSINQNSKLYTESELEQERLDILGSWAQLYITSKGKEDSTSYDTIKTTKLKLDLDYLHQLVRPQIDSLIDKWSEALRDYALLIMPTPRTISSSHDNEHVYTREVALRLFEPVWYRIILAITIWLCDNEKSSDGEIYDKHENESKDFDVNDNCDNLGEEQIKVDKNKYLKFICGIIMKELSRVLLQSADSLAESTNFTLRSLYLILDHPNCRSNFETDITVSREFYTILYSIMINCTKPRSQQHMHIKSLLDMLFNLIVSKFSTNSNLIFYTLAFVMDAIVNDLTKIEQTTSIEHTNQDKMMTNISLRLLHLSSILRLYPKILAEQDQLQSALVNTYRLLLETKPQFVSALNFLEHLDGSYTSLPESQVMILAEELFDHKMNLINRLLDELNSAESIDKDKRLQLDTYLRSCKSAITFTSKESRPTLIASYLKKLIRSSSVDGTSFATDTKSVKTELFHITIKSIKEVEESHPEEFSLALNLDLRELYNSTMKLQTELKIAQDIKCANEATRESNLKLGSQTMKTTKKIVLKSDFSNFYTKKL